MKARAVARRPGAAGTCRYLGVAVLVMAVAGVVVAQQAPFPRAAGPPVPVTVTEVAEALVPVALTEFVTLDYLETPAEDVINAIARATGKNIVWAKKAKKDSRVNVHVRNVEWRDALRMVLDQIGGVIIEETPTRVLIDTPKPLTAEWVEDDLKLVIETIARIGDASVIVGPDVQGTVTARVVNQPWTRVLEHVVQTAGFVTVREVDIIRIVHPRDLQQQLVTRVFKLKYVLPPPTYRPRIDSEYLTGGPVATGSDARRALAAVGAGMQPAFAGQLGAPAPAAPARTEEVQFPLFFAVQSILTRGIGQVTYDPDRNALIVTDTEPVLKQLEEVLARLDTEPEQVYVDVKFVTIRGPISTVDADNVTDLLEFGVDWSNGLTASHMGPGGISSTFPWGGQRARFGTAAGTPGILDFTQLTTVLQLLKTDGNAEIVQAPKLTVLDHHEATIFVGETVRFAETVSASNQAGGVEFAVQEATNSPVDTGFQLLIIPHIVPGTDKVILTLIPQRNTLEEFDTYAFGPALQITLPRVSSDTVVTKMLLHDKDTAVIGGLMDETNDEVVRKIPFLGDIPVIGWLFKRQSIIKTRRNLVIFVTVHIVRRRGEMVDMYRNYQDYDLVSTEYYTPFDLQRRRRAEQVAAAVRQEAEPVAPEAEAPGWQQTPEGVEYTVPAKGAEQEETEIEVELIP